MIRACHRYAHTERLQLLLHPAAVRRNDNLVYEGSLTRTLAGMKHEGATRERRNNLSREARGIISGRDYRNDFLA